MATDSLQTSNPTSLFVNHYLQTNNIEPLLNPYIKQYWVSWLIIVCFAVYVWLQFANRKKMIQIFSAAISARNIEEIIRKEYALTNRLSITLSAFFLFITSLFITQTQIHFQWMENTSVGFFVLMLQVLGVLTLFYICKLLLIRFTGIVFEVEQQAYRHIFSVFVFNQAVGFLLFPLVVIIQFVETQAGLIFMYITLGGLMLFYLNKFIRTTLFGMQGYGISNVHLFLYICTLEILPLVVVIKMFVSKI